MFEVDPRIGAAGAAVRAGMAAASNARIAQRYQDSMESWREYARKLEKEIGELKWKLLVAEARAEGLKAYRNDLRAAHPNSPRLAPSGRKYKDGTPKPLAALAYDREFDRILTEARISNPEQYRD